MAKTRDREQSRERMAPPPRMTGISLMQVALFAGLVAVLMAFLGAFMAGGSSDPNAEKNADSLGAALCAVVTAPEPEWWSLDHGSTGEMRLALKQFFPRVDWGVLEKAAKNALYKQDFERKQRNKKRLEAVENALGTYGAGVLRGLQIVFVTKSIKNHYSGARIDPSTFTAQQVIGDIEVGTATASTTGSGAFSARVYHRPYKNSRGAVIGDAYVILSKSVLQAKKGSGPWLMLTPLLVGIALVLLIVQVNTAVGALRSVARDLDMIGRGKLDHRVHVGNTGEVGLVQRMTERMAKNLQLIQSTGSTDLDEAIEKEMDLASEIHQSLRPAEPPRLPGFELETLFKGGSEIGGDYFDYAELDAHRTALIIADCSESLRGVPAAMVMAMTRAYLKAAIDPDTSPADWLRWVNRRLARDLKSGMAVTALVVVLDTDSGELMAASAGHRPIVMWRKGKTALINPNGIALGLDVGPVFDKTIEEKRFTMHKNDRIVMYTDGVISAENSAGEAYGEERFLEAVRRQGAMNSAAFVNFVAGGVERFLDGLEQPDDITISTLKKMK